MIDCIELGTAPYDESCVQVGSEDYREKALVEAKRFKKLLIKKFGEPPEGAYFVIKSYPHDFGNYYELVIKFDETIEAAINYAFLVDNNLPSNWND